MDNHKSTAKIIAITGGKGGIGKSVITGNLAVALGKMGNSVLLIDADLGLSNLNILFNIKTTYHLGHLINNECDIEQVINKGPTGVDLISGGSGVELLANLSRASLSALIQGIVKSVGHYDYILIDTAAGMSPQVTHFAQIADSLFVVLCDEPHAFSDAYALIKCLHQQYHRHQFFIIPNRVDSAQKGQTVFNRLYHVAADFLGVSLNFAATIVNDDHVRQAVRRRAPINDLYPASPFVLDMYRLAKFIATSQKVSNISLGIKAFSSSS